MSREQRRVLDAMLREAPQPEGEQTVEQERAGFAGFMGSFVVPDGVIRTRVELGGRSAVLVEPDAPARSGTILYFHGGSFSLGSPDTAMVLTANLVERTSVRALSLDYRLAPEHPFPAAVDDALAAYRELLDGGEDAETIVLAGDSAGGDLAVMTGLAAQEAGLPQPAAIVSLSGAFDHTRSGASMRTKESVDPFFTMEGMRRTGARFLAGQDPYQALLAPAVLGDLTGLPPLLLQVGTNEMLLDDSVRLAERARAAGVDVILDVVADVPHVFQAWSGSLEEADQALDRAAVFLTQHLPRR